MLQFYVCGHFSSRFCLAKPYILTPLKLDWDINSIKPLMSKNSLINFLLLRSSKNATQFSCIVLPEGKEIFNCIQLYAGFYMIIALLASSTEFDHDSLSVKICCLI